MKQGSHARVSLAKESSRFIDELLRQDAEMDELIIQMSRMEGGGGIPAEQSLRSPSNVLDLEHYLDEYANLVYANPFTFMDRELPC